MIDNESKVEKSLPNVSSFEKRATLVMAPLLMAGMLILLIIEAHHTDKKIDENVVRAEAEFSELIDFVDSGVKDVTSLLGVSEVTPEVREVVEYSISGEHNGTLKGDVASNLISLVRGAGYSVNESTVDVLAIGDKLNYLHSIYVPEVQKLSELINKEKEYRYDKNTFKVVYEGKDYVGLDAYRLVKDLTEGRL